MQKGMIRQSAALRRRAAGCFFIGAAGNEEEESGRRSENTGLQAEQERAAFEESFAVPDLGFSCSSDD